ncbi:MAG TPA: BrnT family toxin [Terriglobia bacterium]|nr:BrnT family toxin [Terriglobia bacterium]
MTVLRFEWDDTKNTQNRRKHGISFEEAQTVFFDDHALLVDDPDHSEHEERFVLLGLSSALRTLVVCHCYRGAEDVIRLISARRADGQERELYEGRWTK